MSATTRFPDFVNHRRNSSEPSRTSERTCLLVTKIRPNRQRSFKESSYWREDMTSSSPPTSIESSETSKFLRLNVSGHRYEISEITIRRKLDGTLFSFLQYNDNNNSKRDDYVQSGCILLENREFYIERTPTLFELILHYAYTGQLHCPPNICERMLEDEIRFWHLPEKSIERCCNEFREEKIDDSVPSLTELVNSPSVPSVQLGTADVNESPRTGRRHGISNKNLSGKKIQDMIWRLFEDPSSSWAAYILNLICVLFILVSVTNLVVSTIPTLHHCNGNEFLGPDDEAASFVEENYTLPTNDSQSTSTMSTTIFSNFSDPNSTTYPRSTSNTTTPVIRRRRLKDKFSRECEGGFVFDIVETVCIAWFTFEWIVRFSASPNKVQFIKSPLNLIDIFATLPFYVELLLWAVDAEMNGSNILQMIRVMRIGRVLRIFRLARYFDSLQVMGETLWNSRSELGLLIMFLAVSTIIFSTILYYIEKDEVDTKYTSIPASFWWCIVTLTTTGYGDITPSTALGKVAAGCACIVGVLILAFPVSILVEKFRTRYENKRQVRLKKIVSFVHATTKNGTSQ